tara:strand:- start:25 stop:603 length:579 start_codon:yes stop_codon:yes gene_type:complete
MSKIETNQVDPSTGTTLTLGTSGDTIAIPSGVTIANSGTATGFGGAMTPAFEANLSAEQNASNDTYTKMDFDEEVFDTHGAYDHTTNQRFTVPSGQAGKYHIYANVVLGSSANDTIIDTKVLIYKNGSVYSRTITNTNNSKQRYQQLSVASTMVLAVGDYVEIYAQVNLSSGTVEFRAQNREATFGGFKIIE